MGGVVFSYSLSKNWWEPNLGSMQQQICDDLSSVRSGTVVLESVAPGPIACRARLMRGHTVLSLQHRSFREPWMTQSSILPLRLIHADPHHYWSASIPINLPNSVSKEAFSEPQTHFLPSLKATVKQQTHLWRGSWTTTAWSRAHGMDTTLHGCSSQLDSREFWLHAAFVGPNEIHATSPGSNMKSITYKCSFTCTIQFSGRCPA